MREMSIEDIRRVLRADVTAIPRILSHWVYNEGELGHVPILPVDAIAPSVFTQMSGTVRAVQGDVDALTLAGLMETDKGAVIASAIVVTTPDLGPDADPQAAKEALSAYAVAHGHEDVNVNMEVVALIGSIDEGGPAFGTLIARPLLLADTKHPAEALANEAEVLEAMALAEAEDLPIVGDLANTPWRPLEPSIFKIWAPFFAVVRTATIGLATSRAFHDAAHMIPVPTEDEDDN